MKLAIIGSRDFNDYDLLKSTIIKYFSNESGFTFDEVISGAAAGADSLGAKYSKEYGIKLMEYKAEWDNLEAKPCIIKTNKYGKKYNALAGHNRNSLIINDADLILAFWDGKSTGTKDSLTKAKNLKKPTFIIYF